MLTKPLMSLCIAVVILCSACNHDSYLKIAPRKNAICGVWVIDADRTTWKDLKVLLKRGAPALQFGQLEIRPDGRFVLIDFPPEIAFLEKASSLPNLISGSGQWWTDVSGTTGWSYLWLDFSVMNGEPTADTQATLWFQCEGSEYFLCITIWDPDTGDVLVLRKAQEMVRQ